MHIGIGLIFLIMCFLVFPRFTLFCMGAGFLLFGLAAVCSVYNL